MPSVATSNTATSSDTSSFALGRFPKKIFLVVAPTTTDFDLYIIFNDYGRVANIHKVTRQDRYNKNCNQHFAFLSPFDGMRTQPRRWTAWMDTTWTG